MTNDQDMMKSVSSKSETKYDLCDRTVQFGESVLRFVLKIHRDEVRGPLIRQLVRSSTSVGANYMEADEALTKKEFRYRISICCREAKESQYWLRMIAVASPEYKEEARVLWKEAHELTLIFAAIGRKTKAVPK